MRYSDVSRSSRDIEHNQKCLTLTRAIDMCCLFIFDLRILITVLVFSSSSYPSVVSNQIIPGGYCPENNNEKRTHIT